MMIHNGNDPNGYQPSILIVKTALPGLRVKLS
jgi:hypothetical protein